MKKLSGPHTLRNSPAPSLVSDTEIRVRVTPRGGRDAVIGVRADGVLCLRVSAPPVDGMANRACIALLAETLSVKRAQVALTGGETARDKRLRVSDLTQTERDNRLAFLTCVRDG